jgi:hypothetical protein
MSNLAMSNSSVFRQKPTCGHFEKFRSPKPLRCCNDVSDTGDLSCFKGFFRRKGDGIEFVDMRVSDLK